MGFLLILSGLYWLMLAAALVRVILRVPTVESLTAPPPARWPRVALIIPARNEEGTVEEALRSKLSADYPALELVFVDDRSTDGTRRVADALAARDERLRVVHVSLLPEGWLGKVHALDVGARAATGEWLLFSDADVTVSQGTLKRLIARAEDEGIDHIAVLPRVTSAGPLLQPALTSFFRMVVTASRAWAVSDPRSSAAMGIGAFNLVRRSALARSPGFEWLKMEIADDAALGAMLKHSGASSRVYNGRDAVSLEFYPSFAAMVRALEKNGGTATLPGMLLGAALLLALEWAPLLALLTLESPWQLLAAAIWIIASVVTFAAARWQRLAAWPALVPFFGMAPLLFAMTRSVLLAHVRGAVVWRGTRYPLAAVRTGSRMSANGRYRPPSS